ncbi:RNA polymerase sigma factor [Saccharothrix longispora]|uniref:RNA polymerase sigma factor n=1 Tax=Saccharothrix longispora TaxID=33920 RepID=UPI0028FD8727|nr:RNA polymerase sigma factor [Saccharothrix longispora]MBY8847423.1 RNA polymerase sigma factor [Saccharothrix sp. MB29]MDU0290104.1 RNA polymerase sigma factor [Saccharothrix longispora]
MTTRATGVTAPTDAREGPPPEGDRELWLRATSRGPDADAAFTALFERHAEAVWNYAYRLTASWSSADDLLSATFLTAWRLRSRVVLARDSARPWLFTVTANLARDERRAGARLVRLLRRLGAREPQADHAEGVADSDVAARRLRRVLAAVERLPRAEREITRLCLLGGMSAADASRLLGITEATVRSRVSRARARLRDLTQGDDDA